MCKQVKRLNASEIKVLNSVPEDSQNGGHGVV